MKIGGAEISPLHANFFLASSGADWRDVTALRDLAKNSVREKFGVELTEEARIITELG
jgi:UDP-N-acetylmuramate dehydrogenase